MSNDRRPGNGPQFRSLENVQLLEGVQYCFALIAVHATVHLFIGHEMCIVKYCQTSNFLG